MLNFLKDALNSFQNKSVLLLPALVINIITHKSNKMYKGNKLCKMIC